MNENVESAGEWTLVYLKEKGGANRPEKTPNNQSENRYHIYIYYHNYQYHRRKMIVISS